MAKGKRKTKKQLTIKETQSEKRIDDIEKAAADYKEARDERMALTKDEVKTKAALLASMQAHKLTKYRCEDIDCEVELKVKEMDVKVKKIELDVDEGDEEAAAAE